MDDFFINSYDSKYFANFSVSTMIDLADNHLEDLECLLVDNGEGRARSRPTYMNIMTKSKGSKIRDQIASTLASNFLCRPIGMTQWTMERNPYGHLYYHEYTYHE